MNQENTNRWLSAYLFYAKPDETFLSKAVAPFIRTALASGIVSQYFFIRYNDRGPHIRLRLKTDPSTIETLLKPALEDHILSYFQLHPSERVDPRYPDNFPEIHKWLPNNNIQYIPYVSELERFGGKSGMLISENHFQLSSEAVLYYILQKSANWSYNEALGIGIKLHLCFARSVGMDLYETLGFFNYLFYNWLPASTSAIEVKRSKKQLQEKEEATINAFSKAWEDQKKMILPFQEALWDALIEEKEFEDPMLNKWIDGCRQLKAELAYADSAHLLEIKPLRSPHSGKKLRSSKHQKFWPLYSHYIHLTNNRLGIFNHDEGYLAYLIMKGVGVMI